MERQRHSPKGLDYGRGLVSLRAQQVATGVSFEAATRPATPDFPPGAFAAARRAPHQHLLIRELQHFVVPAEPANHLSQPRHPSRDSVAGPFERNLRCCRKLLGVIGHHGRYPSLPVLRTLVETRPFPVLLTSGISRDVPRDSHRLLPQARRATHAHFRHFQARIAPSEPVS